MRRRLDRARQLHFEKFLGRLPGVVLWGFFTPSFPTPGLVSPGGRCNPVEAARYSDFEILTGEALEISGEAAGGSFYGVPSPLLFPVLGSFPRNLWGLPGGNCGPPPLEGLDFLGYLVWVLETAPIEDGHIARDAYKHCAKLRLFSPETDSASGRLRANFQQVKDCMPDHLTAVGWMSTMLSSP